MKLNILILFFGLYLTNKAATVYTNKIYVPYIKTVQLHPIGYPLQMPIIALNSNEKLELHFDDLSMENNSFYYSIIQCHADWSPTTLSTLEYINGFAESTIFDYEYSNSSKQSYIHYKLQFPNIDMNITKSGNYVLAVYHNTIQEPLFTQRFMVVEHKVSVSAQVAYARNLQDRNKYQDISFEINTGNYTINNPVMEIKASVLQNQRWDNAITFVPPYMVSLNNTISYNYYNQFLFPTGREFRQFDTRTLRFKGQQIHNIDADKDYNQVELWYDFPIENQQYNFYNDLNGQYYIYTLDFLDSYTQADYVWTKFNLRYEYPIADGDFYVVGAFNNWQINEESKLTYKQTDQVYTTNLLLKQGFYNYSYVFVYHNNEKDYFLSEGYYYNTENNYTIFIYHTPFGERYDRLIAVKTINSITDR